VTIFSALTGPKYNPSPGNSGQERSNAVQPLLSVAARRIAAYKRHERASLEKAQTSMLVCAVHHPQQCSQVKGYVSAVGQKERKDPYAIQHLLRKTAAILVLGTAGKP
jgi:hypothetical protein